MGITNKSLTLLIGVSIVAFASAASLPARADEVPVLNVAQVCRGIARYAATPGERGGPDLTLQGCISSEQAIRKKLARRWSTFAPADRAECVGEATAGGESSYTDLLTCLQMARTARNYRSSNRAQQLRF